MNTAKSWSIYQQLQSLPNSLVGEVINGQLHTQPRPSGRHVHVASAIGGELWNPYHKGKGGPGGWWIIVEPEVHFIRDQEVLVPDVAGWRKSRMPELPHDQRFEVVPDWVCEVLSPTTESKDRHIKMPVYAKYGVQTAWLVDPIKRILEIYSLHHGQWSEPFIYRDDQNISAVPFTDISILLTDLWQ